MIFRKPLLLILFLSILAIGCEEVKQEVTKLDLELATSKVELFGKGIVSTKLYERDIAISPDGKELIYSLGDYKQQKRCLVQIIKKEGKWGDPQLLSISGTYQDIEPFYAEEGRKLFFASNRPIEKGSKRTDYNIWYSERDGTAWSEPKALNEIINTEKDEFYPSLSRNGNLYFTASRQDGMGLEDIFVSELVDGVYQKAVALDSTINTKHFEFNAHINPDENLLIFSSFGRTDGYGGGDLYYSTKDKDGNWSLAKNMGEKVNSPQLDYCPFIDIERNNFYFTSERTEEIPSTINNLDQLKDFSNKTENGMGNIYSIGLKELNFN